MPKFGERSFVEDSGAAKMMFVLEREMTRRALESASDELVGLKQAGSMERQRTRSRRKSR